MENTDQKTIDVTVSVEVGTIDELVERKWKLVEELDQLVDFKINTQHNIASIQKEIDQVNEILKNFKEQQGDSE